MPQTPNGDDALLIPENPDEEFPQDDFALNQGEKGGESANANGELRSSSDDEEDKKYPSDCYSFIALNGPHNDGWPRKKILFFIFGMTPFFFQTLILVLLVMSVTDEKHGTMPETDNPDGFGDDFSSWIAKFIPSDTSPIVRMTQVVSIMAYVLFPDSSMNDVIGAMRYYPKASKAKAGDHVMCMRFSCFLKGLQGTIAIFATLLLVMTSNTVVEIILNFTAVNFVSNIDDIAFTGELGKPFKYEALKIERKTLPESMYRRSKHTHYSTVVGSIFTVLFLLMLYVFICQKLVDIWKTPIFRVQFQEVTGIQQYSGCFQLDKETSHFGRHNYHSWDNSSDFSFNSSFGYCRENRQWILYKGDNPSTHPCDARKEGSELARSSKTNDFDIATSFENSWVTSSNTPLDLYFFANEHDTNEDALHCESIVGDGKCDEFLNKFDYGFDGGDCCSASCLGSNCGKGGLKSMFGQMVSADGFPNCTNDDMKAITISLNNISSSRNERFVDYPDYLKLDDNEAFPNETIWRGENPVEPILFLDCDDKNVLSIYISESMENQTETVMVEDGSNCTLTIRNNTAFRDIDSPTNDPILFVDYTIFHGKSENIEILTSHSNLFATENFRRIPECYFSKLESHIDAKSMYVGSGLSHVAFNWLLDHESKASNCEDDFFLERYGLTTTYFGMDKTKSLISSEPQCRWKSIICTDGKITEINLDQLPWPNNLSKLPTEIGLLENLKVFTARKNKISLIPSEIGLLRNVQHLDFGYNNFSYIPPELGSLSILESLDLSFNNVSSMPSEIGLLTRLKSLDLCKRRHVICFRTVELIVVGSVA